MFPEGHPSTRRVAYNFLLNLTNENKQFSSVTVDLLGPSTTAFRVNSPSTTGIVYGRQISWNFHTTFVIRNAPSGHEAKCQDSSVPSGPFALELVRITRQAPTRVQNHVL
jgi:hypothetical protein